MQTAHIKTSEMREKEMRAIPRYLGISYSFEQQQWEKFIGASLQLEKEEAELLTAKIK